MNFQETFSALCVFLLIMGAIAGVVFLIMRSAAKQAKAEIEEVVRREKQIQMMELLIRNARDPKGQVIALVYAANNGFMDKDEVRRTIAKVDKKVFHGRPIPAVV
jgi:uncharacterized protein (DUF2141 family)